MCLGGIATFGFPRRQLRAGAARAAGSCSCCCAAASTASPRWCRTAIRRTVAARRARVRRIRAGRADRHLRPRAGPRAAARAVADRTSSSSLHAMAIPYRTRSHFDGQAILETGIDRPVGIVRRLAEPAAAGDARPAIRHRDRVGHAALDDRPVRRADLVADAARRRRRRVPRSARDALPHGQRRCTAGSRRRCSSRISSAKSRWRAAARGAAASRR